MASLNELFSADVAKKLKSRGAIPEGVPDIHFLQTGIYMLDWAIGGGLPKGRISEISGKPGTGKTTTALIIAQYVIANGGRVAWFEAEEALDPLWMLQLGIPEEEVYWDESDSLINTHFHIYHPSYLEQGLENLRLIAPTDVYDFIVYDSIGGSPTLAAYEADIEKNQMTQVARVMGRFCAVMPQDIKKSKAAVLFTNMVYDNLAQTYLDPLKPHGGMLIAKGGQGMAFLSTVRMMTYEPKMVKDTSDNNVGKMIKARIYKNKVLGGIQREFTYNIMHDHGMYIDVPQDIIDTSNLLNLLGKAGAWYTFNDESIHGDTKFKEKMKDPEFALGIVEKLENEIAMIHSSKKPSKNLSLIEGVINESSSE